MNYAPSAAVLPAHTALRTQAQAPKSPAPGMLEINVNHGPEVDSALEKAIERVKSAAFHRRTGIMVSRVSAGRYIVRAHPQVPFGLTRQRYE